MALAYMTMGLTPQEFLGTAFWIGFSTHLIAAETWINYTRQRMHPEQARNLLERYRTGNCSADEVKLVEQPEKEAGKKG